MKNFAPKKRPNAFGERPSMHTASCHKCGNSCEVPFKPNGRKPVFCGTCFRKEDHAAPKFDRSAKFQKPTYQSTPRMGSAEVAELLKLLDGKMDQILEALEDLSKEA